MELGTRRLVVRLGVSLAFAAAFGWWVHNQGIAIIPPLDAFVSMAPWGVPGYLGSLAVVHFCRAYRWTYLLRPIGDVPARRMLPVAFVGFVAILMLPLRMGELARPLLIKRHAGVSMSAALGTIAIERVVDGLLVSLLLTLCLFVVPADASPYVWPLRLLPLALFVAALGALVIFLLRGDRVTVFFGRLTGRVSEKLSRTVVHVLQGFSRGLAVLPNRGLLLRFLAVSAVYWSANALGVLLLARGCGLDLDLFGAVATMGTVAVGILLPSGPGFFGNFQAAVLVALGLFIPIDSVAASVSVFIFTLYACQVLVTVLVGVASVLFGGLSLRGLTAQDLPRVASEDVRDWS